MKLNVNVIRCHFYLSQLAELIFFFITTVSLFVLGTSKKWIILSQYKTTYIFKSFFFYLLYVLCYLFKFGSVCFSLLLKSNKYFFHENQTVFTPEVNFVTCQQLTCHFLGDVRRMCITSCSTAVQYMRGTQKC